MIYGLCSTAALLPPSCPATCTRAATAPQLPSCHPPAWQHAQERQLLRSCPLAPLLPGDMHESDEHVSNPHTLLTHSQ